MSKQLEAHEYASIFPMATDEELKEMASDIEKRGLLNAIITLEGKILDGRNRARACDMVGAVPWYEEYKGTDPLGDVISWNLHRRQLSTSQRATVALSLKPMFEQKAKQNQIEGGKSKGLLNSTKAIDSFKQSADAVNVSRSVVQDAQFVRDNDPVAFEEVKAGKITVNKAKEQIKAKAQEKEEERYTAEEKEEQIKVNAQIIADKAIFILTSIKKSDKGRTDALKSVIKYCNKTIKE